MSMHTRSSFELCLKLEFFIRFVLPFLFTLGFCGCVPARVRLSLSKEVFILDRRLHRVKKNTGLPRYGKNNDQIGPPTDDCPVIGEICEFRASRIYTWSFETQ